MNRVLYGVITVVVMICFCGIVPSAARVVTGVPQMKGDQPAAPNVVADVDEKDNDVRDLEQRTSERWFYDYNYIKEVYTSTVAPAGEDYNSRAIRAFYYGEDVYLVVRFSKAYTGNYRTYYIVSDQTGAVIFFYSVVGSSTTTGAKYNQLKLTGLAVGCYYFNTIILANGNYMISPPGYTFIVE